MNVNFTHIALGKENDICIAHILDHTVSPYAVVKHPNINDGSWAYAIQYCKTYEEAKQVFNEKMGF